jgi:formylglycine-generating enzyme required for sulfatase activity
MRIGLSLLGLAVASIGLYLLSEHINALGLCLIAWSALCIGWWQAKRLKVNAGKQPQAKPKVPAWRFWGLRLTILLASLAVIVGAYSQYLARTYQLPNEYHLQAATWVLGINLPYPELVTIPAGSFEMGSNEKLGSNEGTNEQPTHTVTLPKSFQMGKYEVSFTEYDYYVWKMRQAASSEKNNETKLKYPENEGWGRLNRPIINVGWQASENYTHWLSQNHPKSSSCRLPSEAEWEYAARAGSKTKYYWGDEPSRDYTNSGKEEGFGDGVEGNDKWANTAPVGSFKPNPWGLHDMTGNVYEWVQDRYHENYQGAPEDGSAWESGDHFRVIRGGSWNNSSVISDSTFRAFGGLGISSYDIVGFRIVCSSIDY